MRTATLVLVGLLLCLQFANGLNGIDSADAISVSQFTCLKQNSYTLAILRGYRSVGQIDPNCKQNIQNAKQAGLEAEAYHFP